MSIPKPAAQHGGVMNLIASVPLKTLVTLATETWRVRRKLMRLEQLSLPEVSSLSASIERLGSCLQEMGIECKEYDGQPYDDGLNVKVLDYEDSAELAPGSECIVRTVLPGILVQGTLIRQGEVVVGRGPHGREDADDAEHC